MGVEFVKESEVKVATGDEFGNDVKLALQGDVEGTQRMVRELKRAKNDPDRWNYLAVAWLSKECDWWEAKYTELFNQTFGEDTPAPDDVKVVSNLVEKVLHG